MSHVRRLRELFLHAGLEEAVYEELLPTLREQNRMLLRLFSQLATIAFCLLFLVSVATSSAASANALTYLMTGAESLVILVATYLVLPRHPSLVSVFVYVFIAMLHVFGIHIALVHIEYPAVSAVAFLLVTPLMFYDRPFRMSILIAGMVVLCCAMSARFKEPAIANLDIWNTITFGIVAIATTTFTMSAKIRALAQSRQIEYLSQTDLLCGTKNRNHYENRLEGYPDTCTESLACLYGDVNGLHEMNNRKGHAAGDEMLRAVARIIQDRFGPEDTYRIGGDEFCAFRTDTTRDAMLAETGQMEQELERLGYHVSFGVSLHRKAEGALDMHSLVREAEKGMYASKQAYYERLGQVSRER